MAFISGGFWSSIAMADNGGNVTTKTYELDAADSAEAATNHAAVLAALTNVTDARIISHYWYEKLVQDTPTLPGAGVQIEDMALLTFEIAGNPLKSATHTIPAPKIGIFSAASGSGANVVDLANVAVVAYRSLFQSAGECFISDGEKAQVLKSGKRIHRKSRSG